MIQALKREILEEAQLEIDAGSLKYLGKFEAEAIGQESVHLVMEVFIINRFTGEPIPSSGIEEIKWINTRTNTISLGSIFEHDVMSLLNHRSLID
jgi:8-oxo-dGTP pyrophosphatase MutT (NUDIX family)